jgi:phosphatidylglycerol lysyltransferase
MNNSQCPLDTSANSRIQRARDLVMRFGWNVVSYQILNPGIQLWFSRHHDAVIGYVRRHGVRVVAGAPVCDEDDLIAVIKEWEDEAERAGEGVCYFAAAGRLHELLKKKDGYSTVVLGAQPVWHPADWAKIFASRSTLRAQLSRAKNKGVTVNEWSVKRAGGNPELKLILWQWLRSRGLPSLHFLVEPRTLDCLGDRRIFVAEKAGQPVGFLVLAPAPRRNGYLTEQFVRGAHAPNGTVELMLTTATRVIAGEGASYITMGLVPLSQFGSEEEENPLWLRVVIAWTRAHGRRFYNFGGLETFKAKFEPSSWEPIYAISNQSEFTPRTLYAIAAAFTRRPVWVSLSGGLRRAVRREVKWWREGRAERPKKCQ